MFYKKISNAELRFFQSDEICIEINDEIHFGWVKLTRCSEFEGNTGWFVDESDDDKYIALTNPMITNLYGCSSNRLFTEDK